MLESISIVLMTDWNSIQFLLRLAMSLSPSKLDAFPRSTGYSEDFKPSKQIGETLWNWEVVMLGILQYCCEIRRDQFQQKYIEVVF